MSTLTMVLPAHAHGYGYGHCHCHADRDLDFCSATEVGATQGPGQAVPGLGGYYTIIRILVGARFNMSFLGSLWL